MKKIWNVFLIVLIGLNVYLSTKPALGASFDVNEVVDTDEAVFFTKSSEPRMVFYFPHTEVVFEKAEPSVGTARDHWSAKLQLKKPRVQIPFEVKSAWSDRSFTGIRLRTHSDCNFITPDEARKLSISFVTSFSSKLGTDVDSSSTASICRYDFSVDQGNTQTITQLKEKAQQGVILKKVIQIELKIKSSATDIQWKNIHSNLKRFLQVQGSSDSIAMQSDEAIFLLGLSVAGDPKSLENVARLSRNSRIRFLDDALSHLFSLNPGTQSVSLTQTEPNGSFEGDSSVEDAHSSIDL
jgi:hypothetical protein